MVFGSKVETRFKVDNQTERNLNSSEKHLTVILLPRGEQDETDVVHNKDAKENLSPW